MTTKNAVIWTQNNCVEGILAAKAVVAQGYTYAFNNIDSKEFTKDELLAAVPGVKTVPQIFIDGELVGGLPQLLTLLKITATIPK